MAGPICAKCDLEMRPGYVPEWINSGVTAAVWHPTLAPKPKGLVRAILGSPSVEYEEQRVLPLEAWRCYGCGRVEFFAGRPGAKESRRDTEA